MDMRAPPPAGPTWLRALIALPFRASSPSLLRGSGGSRKGYYRFGEKDRGFLAGSAFFLHNPGEMPRGRQGKHGDSRVNRIAMGPDWRKKGAQKNCPQVEETAIFA
jgi:hypothetical protein